MTDAVVAVSCGDIGSLIASGEPSSDNSGLGAGFTFPANGLFITPLPGASLFVRDANLSTCERRNMCRYEMLM